MSKFSVKQAISDADLEPFPFEDADGVDQALPHMKALSASQMMRLLRDGQIAEVLAEVGVEPAISNAMADWPGHVLEPFIQAWMDHSDVKMPGGEPGKIAGLFAVLDAHAAAVEADLAWRGQDLAQLSVRKLIVLVDALLDTPGTQLHRALSGDDWTLTDHLLALVYDQLTVANWQRSKDGSKGRNKPEPLSPLAQKNGQRYGKTDRSPEEVKAYLARFGPAPS